MCWFKLKEFKIFINCFELELFGWFMWKLKLLDINRRLGVKFKCLRYVENFLRNRVMLSLFVVDGGGW